MSRKVRIKECALYVVVALVMLSIYLYFQVDRTPGTTFEYPEIEKVRDATDEEAEYWDKWRAMGDIDMSADYFDGMH